MDRTQVDHRDEHVAVIGIAARFPGAASTDADWQLIDSGRISIETVSEEELRENGIEERLIADERYVRRGGFVDAKDSFDAGFFGVTPREAEILDPQHRVFLEESYRALEDAGYAAKTQDALIGVFGSASPNYYWIDHLARSSKYADRTFEVMVGNDKDYLSTRVAYKLNCRGPAFTVQSACSGSLVAVQMGYSNLLNYQCDLALCGGVSITVPYRHGYKYSEGHIYSADGHCRPFDLKASGTVFSEGAGVVVLKRLNDAVADGDHIYAVIRGAAVTNDGSRKVGFTAPSVQGQVDALRRAYSLADVDPDSIGYVETHGTGTALGDPIEFSALASVFPVTNDHRNYCALGSVKANIGHADSAAGIAGFIKAVLAIYHGRIPVLPHFTEENAAIDSADSAFMFPTESRDWDATAVRRAGVTALGVGGTNVHVVLEEPPRSERSPNNEHDLLLFSAKSASALKATAATHVDHLLSGERRPVSDAAFTLALGRPHYAFRTFAVTECAANGGGATAALYQKGRRFEAVAQSTAFMFTGQGAQFAGMGRALYQSQPLFSAMIDECQRILTDLGSVDLKRLLLTEPTEALGAQLRRTAVTQPVLFSLEYALARQLLDWGVKPTALIGHSLGEYTAACLAGVFGLPDALALVAARGALMQQASPGTMLATNAPASRLEPLLIPGVELCVVNGPSDSVVGGPADRIEEMKQVLEEQHIRFIALKTSHAFHSDSMASTLQPFRDRFESVVLNAPLIPIVSNVTGDYLSDAQATDPDYWVSHVRRTVRFYDGVRTLLGSGTSCFLEIGPGTTLTDFARRAIRDEGSVAAAIPSMRRHDEEAHDDVRLLGAVGEYWARGGAIDLERVFSDPQRHRVPLPGYSFDRASYWFPASESPAIRESRTLLSPGADQLTTVSAEDPIAALIRSAWSDAIGMGEIADDVDFYDLGGDSVASLRVVETLNSGFGIDLPPNALFLAPTIRALRDMIDSELMRKHGSETATSSSMPLLFPVRAHGDRPPLFLVPGAHENRYFDAQRMANSYQDDLIRYISTMLPHFGADQPVYGFRPRGIVAWEVPRVTVRAMARDFIREMRKIQPSGPYIIIGECVGGIVAYEMARQLLSAGDEVARLILMDTWRPTFWGSARERLVIRRRLFMKGLRRMTESLFASSVHTGQRVRNGLSEVRYRLMPLGRGAREQRRLRNGSYTYERVLMTYRPQLLCVRAHVIMNSEWYARHPELRWDDETLPLRVTKIIPGNHVTRVRDYGHLIGEYIREVVSVAMSEMRAG